MNQQIKLGIGERLILVGILSEYKGQAGGIYQVFKMIEKVEIGEKEIKEIELKSVLNERGRVNTNWNKKKEKVKTIELTDTQYELLKGIINAKQDFEMNRFLVSLFEKLNIVSEESDVVKEAGKIIKK